MAPCCHVSRQLTCRLSACAACVARGTVQMFETFATLHENRKRIARVTSAAIGTAVSFAALGGMFDTVRLPIWLHVLSVLCVCRPARAEQMTILMLACDVVAADV
jgi:hypothetical protein